MSSSVTCDFDFFHEIPQIFLVIDGVSRHILYTVDFEEVDGEAFNWVARGYSVYINEMRGLLVFYKR